MVLNAGIFFAGSVLSFPEPLERLQGAQFVNVFESSSGSRAWGPNAAGAEDLLIMAQRIIGGPDAQSFFQNKALQQGKEGYLPDVTPEFIADLERELAGSVGAATAHAMVGQLTEGSTVSVEDLIAVADEAAQILEYSNRLKAKSTEQDRTASALREANAKLTALSVQKDAFLSQISHELRTPMTSIRSFSEILRDGGTDEAEQAKYARIIHDQTLRLTRLLDDLLDLSVLADGQVTLHPQKGNLRHVIASALSVANLGGIQIQREKSKEEIPLNIDLGRLEQVFINLISNAIKYCDAANPKLKIRVSTQNGRDVVDFIDNGSGIDVDKQRMIFEKFSRIADTTTAGGAGLGLAICREIMLRLEGQISYLPGQGGAAFRVTLPERKPLAQT